MVANLLAAMRERERLCSAAEFFLNIKGGCNIGFVCISVCHNHTSASSFEISNCMELNNDHIRPFYGKEKWSNNIGEITQVCLMNEGEGGSYL